MAASVQAAQPTLPNPAEATAPRKRRKRAPAAGASDDCFTCLNRGVHCDRRRPYCSQCLAEGNECSGYKTQLTWGMGVASRGKLRGLSLPVAGTKKLEYTPPPQKTRKRQTANTTQHRLNINTNEASGPSLTGPNSARSNPTVPLDLANASPSLPSPYSASGWDTSSHHSASTPIFQTNLGPENVSQFNPFGLSESTIPLSSPRTQAFPQQEPSPFGHHNRASSSGYRVPLSATHTLDQRSQPPSLHFQTPRSQHSTSFSPFTPSFDPPFPDSGSLSVYPRPDESYVRNDGFEPPRHSYHESIADDGRQPQRLDWPQPLDEDCEVEEVGRQEPESACTIPDDRSIRSAPLSLDFSLSLTPFTSATGIGKTSRMQFLINYYAEVISPVIVAFDGPNNPYRTRILRLAQTSETLQHAISALAASNLRQRRETGVLSTGRTDPARRSSMAHVTLTDELSQEGQLLSIQDQVREETFHKNYAIKSLNQQLADPLLRKDDSILAVLLVLCLFHICDSGVAKFQTQFAGVKKLLSLRGADIHMNNSGTKWFTRMFTWFDAMTASVNDREGQLQGHHLDISALSDEEWSLENLAGCDGQLFKTIAKLGRLNLLSQGKPVDSKPLIVSRPLASLPFPQSSDYSNFDGNGWMRIVADENLFTSKTAEPDDGSTQFWREWREIRQTLQTWQLDPTNLDRNDPDAPSLTSDQRIDLGNISESFRYSALLYTERLADPTAPSDDPKIQTWVRRSLDHIELVKSDVYLLWPLFITGSECVEEMDRTVIRERCLDIQKDSGFMNNKSCLDLIEKIWRGEGEVEAHKDVQGGLGEIGFKFRRVMEMEGNGGEYIVV